MLYKEHVSTHRGHPRNMGLLYYFYNQKSESSPAAQAQVGDPPRSEIRNPLPRNLHTRCSRKCLTGQSPDTIEQHPAMLGQNLVATKNARAIPTHAMCSTLCLLGNSRTRQIAIQVSRTPARLRPGTSRPCPDNHLVAIHFLGCARPISVPRVRAVCEPRVRADEQCSSR